MQQLQSILAALGRGIGRLWARGRWGKIAVSIGALVLACCSFGIVGAIINPQPRTAVQPTAAATRAQAVAVEPTSAPTAVSAPATVALPTAIPVTPTTARERGVMIKTDLGDAWPLTVDAIRLRCLPGTVLVFDADGTTYALNGTARSKKQYAEIDPIWRDNPRVSGLKISVRPLLDAGLALCE